MGLRLARDPHAWSATLMAADANPRAEVVRSRTLTGRDISKSARAEVAWWSSQPRAGARLRSGGISRVFGGLAHRGCGLARGAPPTLAATALEIAGRSEDHGRGSSQGGAFERSRADRVQPAQQQRGRQWQQCFHTSNDCHNSFLYAR